MKFRKKPVVIEAQRLIEGAPTPEGLNFGWPCSENETHPLQGKYWVSTLEGPLTASMGDWIIKGVNGEFYPCKSEIFEKTYERVEE